MSDAIQTSVTSALDPKFSTRRITVDKLDLSPIGEANKDKLAFLLRHVFTSAECQQLIHLSEAQGFEEALVTVADGKAVKIPGYRDGYRVMIDDPEFVKILFQRISTNLPKEFAGNKLLEINERLRFLRYGPNDKFQPHLDGSYARNDAETFITLQMYLNDNSDFEGGATTFLQSRFGGNRIPIKPETGMILVFQHDILHEGSVVNSGTKYTIRGDVLYTLAKSITPDNRSKQKQQFRKK